MSTTKRALLIGCNYSNDPANRLYGCINDVIHMSNTLVDAFDYDMNNITMLRDDTTIPSILPTRANILSELNKLVQMSSKLTEIWIHYSGHGSQVKDANGDEMDGLDEVIVPSNFKSAGCITDDEIFEVLKKIYVRCRVVLLFDSCHSGSVCDLAYMFQTNGTSAALGKKMLVHPNIYCFSGCKDPQTSADAYSSVENRAVGAFSYIFLYCLRKNNFNVDVFKLYADICKTILQNGFEQTPQFSCSSSKPNMVFGRYTFRDTATLKNPMPNLLRAPITVVKQTTIFPVVKTNRKPSMNMVVVIA